MWDALVNYWHLFLTAFAAIDAVLVVLFIAWILALKKDATAAIAWSLLVILLPFFGMMLFLLFGYQSVQRPLTRKKKHRAGYRARQRKGAVRHLERDIAGYGNLGKLAERLNGAVTTPDNAVTFFHEGPSAFDAMFEVIKAAKHHIHIEFFIFRTDELGEKFLGLLAEKARAGVEVRLLTDGIGARAFGSRQARALCEAGGRWASFLPISIWRWRLQVNLRNHRKLVVIDGETGFTGGLNVGVEYLGEDPTFGKWRDTFLRLQGPAVVAMQQVFVEDWDFSTGELLDGREYFPDCPPRGDVAAQAISSGPDDDTKGIREIYFAAMLRARKRLWITTPYYVPDAGIRDAIRLAALSGADVRLLVPQSPDHWIPHFAGRYYLPELLESGVKVYMYANGFIHAKVILVDGKWASVGSANLDNRSLALNFELNVLFHTPWVVAELEKQFLHDIDESQPLDARTFAKRKWPGRLLENVCRLFSPVL